MPSTVIDVRTSYTPAQELAIIEAVQSALVQAFKIPLHDRSILLTAHLPHRMITPLAMWIWVIKSTYSATADTSGVAHKRSLLFSTYLF